MTGGVVPAEKVRDYVLAGHSTLTLENPESGGRFTFRVDAPKEIDGNGVKRRNFKDPIRFVSVLIGPDNTSNFRYIGFVRNDDFRAGGKGNSSAPSFMAFDWFWKRVARGIDYAPVLPYHDGRCGRCGRKLTVPQSIEAGIGPVCAGAES